MKNKSKLSPILWFFSILFIIGAFGGFSESILAAFLCLLFGISLNPLFWALVSKKVKIIKGVKFAIPAILFLLTGIAMPSSNSTGATADSITSTTEPINIEETGTVVVETQTESTVGTVTSTEAPAEATQMTVHFIDVGQADCILIESGSHYMLVDAGNNEDTETIGDYLTAQGVQSLDYVIGTHPHEDHIGSLDYVIENYKVDKVILPPITHTTQTFEDVLSAIKNKNLKITKPVVGDEYAIGDAKFTIIAPNKDYDDLNNWSVGIKLTNGDNSFVMCGDAESLAETDIVANGIDITANVLKVGHHGSNTSSSEAFLDAVNPKYAVIMCGKDNSYGHPNMETLDALASRNIQIFRTDEQGTVVVVSDGHDITWNYSPSETMQPGAPPTESETTVEETTTAPPETTIEETTATPVEVTVHITNTGSKYHRAGCQYLKKSDISVSLNDAKSRGLTPCSKCNPPR